MNTNQRIHFSIINGRESYERSITLAGLEVLDNINPPKARTLFKDILSCAWYSYTKPYDTMLVSFDYKSFGYDKSNYFRYRKILLNHKLIYMVGKDIFVNIQYANYFTNTTKKYLYDRERIEQELGIKQKVPLPPQHK